MTNDKQPAFTAWKQAMHDLAIPRRQVIATKLALSDARIALKEAGDAEIKR